MWVHVFAEPAQDPWLPASIAPAAMYGKLHMGSSQVPICLRNQGACPIVVPARVIIGNIAPANQVPPVTLPAEILGGPASGSQKDWILDELNLQGLDVWPTNEQRQARELLTRWEHSNLDVGKTSLMKH